jgi:phage baseplate assembly protein W
MAEITSSEVALKLPLSLDKSGNLVLATSQEEIWADRVRIALGTRLGERVMRPSYGTTIGESLFDTVTTTSEAVTKEVQRVFHEQFTLLSLKSVTPSFNELASTLTITIVYLLPNKNEVVAEVGIVTVSDTSAPFEEIL